MTEANPAQQLIFELGMHSDMQRFLHSAVQLAKFMNLSLAAILQQDERLLQAASVPVVREVCLWTAHERQTSTSYLARSMRIQARLAGNLLTQIAEREHVACTLVARQQAPDQDQETASAIFWAGGQGLNPARAQFPVCAVDSGEPSAHNCLAQAARLANSSHRPLKVYKLEGAAHGADPEVMRVWLRDARELPCYALFIPRSLYPRPSRVDMLDRLPFPVLLA